MCASWQCCALGGLGEFPFESEAAGCGETLQTSVAGDRSFAVRQVQTNERRVTCLGRQCVSEVSRAQTTPRWQSDPRLRLDLRASPHIHLEHVRAQLQLEKASQLEQLKEVSSPRPPPLVTHRAQRVRSLQTALSGILRDEFHWSSVNRKH